MAHHLPPRALWGRAFQAVDAPRLHGLADRLATVFAVQPTTPPRAGLALLRLGESVQGDTFHVGELPVAQATVRLTTPDGLAVEGGAIAMADQPATAIALAVLDGVLAHDLPGSQEAAALLAEGMAALGETQRRRATMLERTRVDFTAMTEAPGDADAGHS